MVQFDRSFCNRKPQANASAGSSSVLLHPIERVENARERFSGHARAIVANYYLEVFRIRAPFESHIHAPALRRITDGIANDVFDGAP